VVRLLRVWFTILVLLGSAIGSVRIGPVAALQGLVEESRGEWGIGTSDSAEESASQWALLGSKRSVLKAYAQRPPTSPQPRTRAADPSGAAVAEDAVQHRPLPRVLFRRSLPGGEEPPLICV
jgi:hypothetical protein